LQSDDLFGHAPAAPADAKTQWEAVEKRINRLLEGIVQLRNANAQIMKENLVLKNQMKDMAENAAPASSGHSSDENLKLKKQYETALDDLKQVKQNLQRIENLASELKLEEH
jgi:regulator of replication initiation timing